MIGLRIFRCRSEIAWELTPNESGSQNTKDFAVWCGLVSKARGFNERAGVCRVVRFTTQFFLFWIRPKQFLLEKDSNSMGSCQLGFHRTQRQKITAKDYCTVSVISCTMQWICTKLNQSLGLDRSEIATCGSSSPLKDHGGLHCF